VVLEFAGRRRGPVCGGMNGSGGDANPSGVATASGVAAAGQRGASAYYLWVAQVQTAATAAMRSR